MHKTLCVESVLHIHLFRNPKIASTRGSAFQKSIGKCKEGVCTNLISFGSCLWAAEEVVVSFFQVKSLLSALWGQTLDLPTL